VVEEYATSTRLRNIELPHGIKGKLDEIISEKKENFNPDPLIDPPTEVESDAFFDSLLNLTNYEATLVSAFLSYRISNIYGLNVATEFNILFPFSFKLRMTAPELGISGEAEIDFVIAQTILGEIKSEEWFNFYNIGLAAYALVYEFDRKRNVNLGVVVCPTFKRNRGLPMYNNTTNIKIISEVWRRAFIAKRNKRIQLVKSGKDPRTPDTDIECKGCGYYYECWQNENPVDQT